MKPAPFSYERAASVEEASELLASAEGARILAGGQSLIALMAFRHVRPALLVDINDIPGLGEHTLPDGDGEQLVVGATCRQQVLERWRPSDRRWAAIPQATRAVGNHVTRVRGTVGGSIAHADPAGELPALFLLFDGEISVRSTRGERAIAGAELFTGPTATALEGDELITEVRLAAPPAGTISSFAEVSERSAVAAVAVAAAVSEGTCTWCRIAMCGVGPTPMRAFEAEQALLGSPLSQAWIAKAAEAASAACAPRSDAHGGARFRRALAAALAERNLTHINRQLSGNEPAG